jgi:alanine dehydrogenase
MTLGESRLALTSHLVYELTRAGHRLLVEVGAGEGPALSNEEYLEADPRLVADATAVLRDSVLVAKVYGPVPEERVRFREGLIVLAFLSLGGDRSLLEALLNPRCTAVSLIREHGMDPQPLHSVLPLHAEAP